MAAGNPISRSSRYACPTITYQVNRSRERRRLQPIRALRPARRVPEFPRRSRESKRDRRTHDMAGWPLRRRPLRLLVLCPCEARALLRAEFTTRKLVAIMGDLIFVAVTLVFFALTAG